MDLYLVRLIRHGQSCLLEETKNGWFLPYAPIQRSGKDIKTVVKSNVSESFKKVKSVWVESPASNLLNRPQNHKML